MNKTLALLLTAALFGSTCTVEAAYRKHRKTRLSPQQEKLNENLRDAVRKAEIDTVRELIDAGADVNAPDKYGFRPLTLILYFSETTRYGYIDREANTEKRLAVIRELIANKADVNATNKKGRTALHVAALDNLVEEARVLLENQANVNAETDDREIGLSGKPVETRETPLHFVATTSNQEMTQLLIEYGANVNARSSWNRTPLDIAAAAARPGPQAIIREAGGEYTPMKF